MPNRMPTEPGLCLAKGKFDQEWYLVVEVYGKKPYLEMRRWILRRAEGGGGDYSAIYFGPRLAGPDWRKVSL